MSVKTGTVIWKGFQTPKWEWKQPENWISAISIFTEKILQNLEKRTCKSIKNYLIIGLI